MNTTKHVVTGNTAQVCMYVWCMVAVFVFTCKAYNLIVMKENIYSSPGTGEVHLRSKPSGFISHALKIKLGAWKQFSHNARNHEDSFNTQRKNKTHLLHGRGSPKVGNHVRRVCLETEWGMLQLGVPEYLGISISLPGKPIFIRQGTLVHEHPRCLSREANKSKVTLDAVC